MTNNSEPLPLDVVQVFMRVAESASFTRAAELMGMPRTSVSAAVQRLEALLGARLLHRTTRRVQLTPDGEAFAQRARELLADAEELRQLFQYGPAALQGRLRVDMPVGMARNLVLPRLPQFLQAHPALQIELSSTDRRVDLVGEGFDCVLRVGPLTDSSLLARPLGRLPLINCASPAYVRAFGLPQSLHDLAAHRLIHYLPGLGARSPGFEYLDESGQTRLVPMAGALTVNNSEAYLHGCLAGLGIIQAPEPAMRPWMDRGELVEVLPDFRPAPMPVSLLYAHRRLPRRVQAFMDWLQDIMAPYLASGTAAPGAFSATAPG
ncbi:LysR family transcriptional regulator [Azohydromonas lata]|uniref:LysR family transcriptional regulator n=1 Tax=Azohydromonas lata TaxID=45677 RepID=UPI00082DA1D8|nr:LysR family transcriptional regulator [Azohydromonas lata]